MRIILDMGSGNTCRNSLDYCKRMIDAVKEIDTGKHEVVLKWQLFESEPPNLRLHQWIFITATQYASQLGYKTTASVFDGPSLNFLTAHDIPFVKIACRPRLYGLVNKVPRGLPVILSAEPSYKQPVEGMGDLDEWMVCIPKYPAPLEDYPLDFDVYSDHTEGLALWNAKPPRMRIWEKHFVLERDSGNPDAGPFSLTPDQLKEVL